MSMSAHRRHFSWCSWLVLRVEKQRDEHAPSKSPQESGAKARAKVDVRKAKEEESVSMSLLATLPSVENMKMCKLYWRREGHSQERDQRTQQKGLVQ